MEELKFKVDNVDYILSEEKSPGEGIYYLKVNDRHQITITIMKVVVECPDGSKKTLFRYSPQDVGGTADIAVADCACQYLEENYKR